MIIGSQAVKYHAPHFYRDIKNSDIDFIGTEYESDRRVDFHNPDTETYRYILDNYPDQIYAPLHVIYTLKISHAEWDIHWQKTMNDIQWFQENTECQLDETLYKLAIQDWENLHGKKNCSIDTTNEELFSSDIVERKYSHDKLHEIIKYSDVPIYKKCQINPERALLSKKLFDRLSFDEQLWLCFEEIYVIAIERYLLTDKCYNLSLIHI